MPAAARSVGGNFTPTASTVVASAGNSTTASFACQPNPADDITTPSNPPMTSPPGHHAWTALSLAVFSAGYSDAISGLTTVSTRPHPIPVTSAAPHST